MSWAILPPGFAVMWNMRKDAEAKKVFFGAYYGGIGARQGSNWNVPIPNPKVWSINSPRTLQLFSLFELDVGVIYNKVTSSPKKTKHIWKHIPILFPLKSRLRFHPSVWDLKMIPTVIWSTPKSTESFIFNEFIYSNSLLDPEAAQKESDNGIYVDA